MSAPGRVREGMLNWSGKVRLGKVLSSCNSKYCHNVVIFSLGPIEFSCALWVCIPPIDLI